MLEPMRRHSRSSLIYVLFAMLIAVFALTFNTASRVTSGLRGESSEVMATVDGHDIDSGDLELGLRFTPNAPRPGSKGIEKLQEVQRYERFRFPWSGGTGEAQMLTDIDGTPPPIEAEKVLTELIASTLVAQEASKLGLAVSDAELSRRVLNLQRAYGASLLDDNGNFDTKKYDTFARFSLGTSKASLEAFLRREILRDKVAAIVTQGILLTPAEIDAVVAADSKRPRLEFVAVDAEKAAQTLQVTDADADAWATAHEDKIKAAYEAKGELYKVGDKWDLRAILVEAPSINSPAAADDAKKAEIVVKRDEKRQIIDGLRADLDKAWNGELALPAVATNGDAPAEGDEKKATELQGEEKAARLLGYFSKQATAKTEHLMTKDAGGKFFGESVEALGRTPFGEAVATAVKTAEPLTLIGPVEAPNGWWLLVVEKKTPGTETPLEQVKRTLAKEGLAQERAAGELDKIAQSVLDAATATPTTALTDVVKQWNQGHGKGDGILSAAQTGAIGKAPMSALNGGMELLLGLQVPEQDPNDIPGLGKVPDIVAAAWKLTEAAPLAKTIFKSEDGKLRYVIRLAKEDESKDGNAKDVQAAKDKSRDILGRSVLQMRRLQAWHSYVDKLLKDAQAAGKIKKTNAFTEYVAQQKHAYEEALKHAPADAADAPGAGGLKLQVGGKDMPIQLGGKGSGDKAGSEKANPEKGSKGVDKPAAKAPGGANHGAPAGGE